MSEMVERVARAIKAAGDDCYGNGMSVEDACGILAQAAIAAMREPTREMADAGVWPTVPLDLGNGQQIRVPGLGASPAESWRAMIDAALKP